MQAAAIDFCLGVFTGGLVVSGSWGLFWLVIGSIGLARGTCSWRVVFNSLAVAGIPLLMGGGLMWTMGDRRWADPIFAVGLTVVPLVLTWFGLRQAPDGQRAVTHMLAGVRHLIDDVLGKHQECGGCGHDHDHEPGGCR